MRRGGTKLGEADLVDASASRAEASTSKWDNEATIDCEGYEVAGLKGGVGWKSVPRFQGMPRAGSR